MEDIFGRGALEAIEKYRAMPLRTDDVDRCLKQLACTKTDVLEIGSSVGNGAEALMGLTTSYLGVDYSKTFVDHARSRFPEMTFDFADIRSYELKGDFDAIFAFGTLLFLSPEDLKVVLDKLVTHLRIGGVLFVDMKEGQGHEDKEDDFGKFSFWRYNVKDMSDMLGDGYEIFYEKHQFFRDTQWFSVGFQKNDDSTSSELSS